MTDTDVRDSAPLSLPDRLLVVSQFYRPELIGVAAYATDLAEWFAEQGTKVTALTARPNYPEFEVVEGYRRGELDHEEVNGVDIVRLHTPGAKGGGALRRILHETWLLLGALWALARGRVKRHHHVVSFCPSILLVFAASLLKQREGRHVAVVHDIQSGLATGLGMVKIGLLTRLMQGLERFVLNGADLVVVLTEPMRQRLCKHGVFGSIEVVPLWVNLDAIFPIERPANDKPVVAYSGNLGRKQGLTQIFAMAEILRLDHPEVTLVIRGAGSQREELRRMATKNGLDNVEFRPLVSRDRFNDSIAEADLYLVPQLPSGSDSAIPSKIFDIMAAGRTFVCTAEPGSTLWELMEKTCAFECSPPDSPKALADAVMDLLRSPETRDEMGLRGRRYVEENLDRDSILSRFAVAAQGERGDGT